MPPYLRLGSIPRKRHIAHKREGGYRNEGIYYEEVITTAGFGRAYSIVYHLRPPTRVVSVEPAGTIDDTAEDQPALRHHHLKTGAVSRGGDPISGRAPLLMNEDVILSRCRPSREQAELYRNAGADEILFIHAGRGTLHTLFGPLPFRPFDYVVIPQCTTYRIAFEPNSKPDMLVIEAAGQVSVPARYMNPDGQLKLGAPYSERDLHGPTGVATIDKEEHVPVLIKDGRRLTRYTLAHPPFDVVGWDGMV